MKVSIKRKLITSFLIVSFIFGIASFISYSNMKKSNESYDYLVATVMELKSISQSIQTDIALQSGYYRAYMLYGDNKYIDLMNETNAKIEDLIRKGKELSTLQETVDRLDAIDQSNKEFKVVASQIIEKSRQNKEQALQQGVEQIVPISTQLTDDSLSMYNWLNDDILKPRFEKTQKSSDQARLTLLLISISATLIAVASGIVISIYISRPIVKLGKVAEKVASGDLTVEPITVNSKDEIYYLNESFTKMTNSLREMISSVAINSDQVAASAEQLHTSAEQTSRATETVASAIQEVASSADVSTSKLDSNTNALQEILQGVSYISESSSKVSELSRKTTEEAEEGARFVENNLNQMKFIQESVNRSNSVVSSLSNRSKEIGKILEVISGIAQQTNLLALNAAIEAARAGEHGKGFAVVADEVRKLAEQSQDSTKTIAELISLIQIDTEETVQIMNEVVGNAAEGLKVSELTSHKFNGILESTRNITPQIEQVSSTVQQISASIDEVTHSALEISKMAQANAMSSEEVAASTEEQLASMEEIFASAQALSDMAEELKAIINKFQL